MHQKHCKWYTPELTKLAQHKNRIHKIAKQSNTEEDWRIFRNVRNKYTNLIKATKSKYYSHKLTVKNKNDTNTSNNNNGNHNTSNTNNNNTINTDKIKPKSTKSIQ